MLGMHLIRALTVLDMQITALEKVRESVGLVLNERGPQELEVAAGVHGLSELELNTFVDMTEARYRAKRMDPGAPHATPPTFVKASYAALANSFFQNVQRLLILIDFA